MVYYRDNWYAFIPLLAFVPLISSCNVLYLWFKKFTLKNDWNLVFRNAPSSYAIVVPTYNESKEELRGTLNSITSQISTLQNNQSDSKMMIIVCDGKVNGQNNNKSTDKILIEDLLYENISKKKTYENAYTAWDGNTLQIEMYKGFYNMVPYILLVKDTNYGKRDSLVIIRRLLYLYNQKIEEHPMISKKIIDNMYLEFKKIYDTNIEYLIGTDADTVFELNCIDELLKEITKRPTIMGTVGFVTPFKKSFSLFTLYQYAEYVYAQTLRRQQQSLLTCKVNCLSGCVQVLRICAETCGDKILSKFNHKPLETANIFDQIRSYASEDRNHVSLMMIMYPHVETTQTLFANAYTSVPMSFNIFLSQRRRWNLGTITNDMLLLFSNQIKIYERLQSFGNVLSFSLSPFICVSMFMFIRAIIFSRSMLLLYLSSIIILPFVYALTVPIFIKPMIFKDALYYWSSYIFYIVIAIFVNLITHTYSLWNMDTLTWGKTRQIANITSLNESDNLSYDGYIYDEDDIINDCEIDKNTNNKDFTNPETFTNIQKIYYYDNNYNNYYDNNYNIYSRETQV
jgi:chitin synthase